MFLCKIDVVVNQNIVSVIIKLALNITVRRVLVWLWMHGLVCLCVTLSVTRCVVWLCCCRLPVPSWLQIAGALGALCLSLPAAAGP